MWTPARGRPGWAWTLSAFALCCAASAGAAPGTEHATVVHSGRAPAGTWRQPDRGFMQRPERVLLDRLRHGRVASAKKGRGGRSLAFKLRFENGQAGYFKPEQTFSGTNWYAEVVAFYLDRALGLGRVPPVVSRSIAWSKLADAAGDDRRVPEITRSDDGRVRGALIHWLDEPLEPAVTPAGFENWFRVEPFPRHGTSPLQRASSYVATSQARRDGELTDPYYDDTPADPHGRAAELSDMLLFDYLTLNIDRWGGDNGNVLTLGQSGPLIFLDNAAGFSVGPATRSLMDDRFEVCQRFRKRTVDALRALDVDALGRVLARDPHGPLLSDVLLDGLRTRRTRALTRIAELRVIHGDAAVLW